VIRYTVLMATAIGFALAALPARGQDADAAPKPQVGTPKGSTGGASSSEDDADLATKLANFRGLSGMQDLVDARVPNGLVIRGGVRFEQEHQDLSGHVLDFSQDKINLQAYAGVAALGLFEVGARLPFELDHSTKVLHLTSGGAHRNGDQFGDLDLGGKISLRLGWFSLAPYALATLPTGDRTFDHATGATIGGAVTAALLKSVLCLHANCDAQYIDGGQWNLNWRAGLSVVPIATKAILLRPYAFLQGKQAYYGQTGTDIWVAVGAQALLLDFIQVEAGGRYRFVDNGGVGPERYGPSHDEGSWAAEVGAGVAF
jgi:hypothetical protein